MGAANAKYPDKGLRMEKKIMIIWMLVITAMTASAQSHRTLFDDGWTFSQNGKTIRVNLPHDWDIFEGPHSGKGATGTGGGWYKGGKGEYRKQFTIDNTLVKLHFEGVYQKAEVYVNGQKAGQHHYGYTPFTVDITPYINKGKAPNELVVRVDNSEQPNCRWYSGSGIYRHVWLETMPALHIAENGVFVTTPEASSDQAKVQVEVKVQNESQTDRNATVVVGSAQLMVAVKAGESKTVTTTFFVNNPRLWSPESPTLYEAKVELKEAGVDDGRIVVWILLRAPAIEGLVNDEHAYRVAGVEEGARRGIMAGADEVEPRLLHLANLANLGIVEGHCSQHTVVVVYASTIDEYFLSVEHKTVFGIERERTDAVLFHCIVDGRAILL